eukprot:8582942-Pyramimonas_sp.AAC.1
MIIFGSEMYNILFGKRSRLLDLMKTPSGHLALEVDEYGADTEDRGSMSFTITADPQCEDDPFV